MLSKRCLRTLVALAVGLSCAIVVSPALGAESAWWHISSTTTPTYIHPGEKEATLVVYATNLGDAGIASESSPVTITDTLPAGFTATAISSSTDTDTEIGQDEDGEESSTCDMSTLSCTWSATKPLQPYEHIEVRITVEVAPDASSGANVASVEGGESRDCLPVQATGRFINVACSPKHEGESEAHDGDYEGVSAGPVPNASSTKQLLVGEGASPFGLTEYGLAFENEDGTPEKQAGSHPFQFTTSLAFNESESALSPPALPKDLHVDLPAGLIGNATTLPQCDEADFSHVFGLNSNFCEPDTAVGVATVTIAFKIGFTTSKSVFTFAVPVFNLVPAPGEPARFGFEVESDPVLINTAVRTGRDYGIVANVENITEDVSFLSSSVTLWGVPAAAAHDSSRGWECIDANHFDNEFAPCTPQTQAHPVPFLTMPTSCTGELQTTVQADAWNGEQSPAPLFQAPLQSLTGCGKLPFSASLEKVAPTVQEASKPTGLNVHIHVPQETSLNPEGISGADVKDTTVTLPEGITLNPSGANGLEACTESEIGFQGIEHPSETDLFTPTVGSPFCPDASKIGKVKIKTPVLAHELEGSVYLAAQNENPFGSLVAMYISAVDPVSGVLVKLPGSVSLNPVTGQITSTFANTPQVPFEDLTLEFFGGERAPLSTPAFCRDNTLEHPGEYETQASFTPWSESEPGAGVVSPPVKSSSSFKIDSACPGASLPFAPSLAAGTTSNQAGGFSPLTTTITREDGQQNIQTVQLHMPAGLSGVLSGVKLCGEAEANAGTCGAESEIGSTIVSVGLGGDPYSVTGGKVYLTGPYHGAPFGLSIVNPAVAGPFNLGQVIVRAKVAVDPHTAALTITTNSEGEGYAIPHILDGIPLQIKHINVSIERKGFTFNPTDCNPTLVTGSVNSAEGASSPVAVPFQVTNCAALKFPPKFAAAVAGRSSKPDGASLHVKLTYPTGAMGTQANIAKVKVDLPKQLPSRLTTLQKACLAKVFEADPANCPKESKVGYAKAITPILPVPLEGPAYFVSHGGEAFPSLIVVLQGYGVTVDLVGTTFISKAGITSSTFQQVPDVPVSTFELTLPTGKYSALAANLPAKDKHSFCGQKLAMPTAFVAQDGTEIHESTAIGVTGCPKAKTNKAKKKKAKNKKASEG